MIKKAYQLHVNTAETGVIQAAELVLVEERLTGLQQAITAGLKSGDAGLLDMQAIKHRARLQAGVNEEEQQDQNFQLKRQLHQ